ncbi:thiamine pyrophosphokinase [Whalleya microplaca]|nr:thiamine pyrophosphokinase [Whalleya microplaca]
MDRGEEFTTHAEWHPIRTFLGRPGYDFALVILNQPIKDEVLFRDLWYLAVTRVAADGGANQVFALNQATYDMVATYVPETPPDFEGAYVNLDTIIGDLDSLSAEARDFYGAREDCCIIEMPDQYSTDFTKAVRFVRGAYPRTDIVCLGGLGGRVDQGLSQLHHLYMFQTSPTYADGKMFFLSGDSLTFLLKPGLHRIHVREPDAAVDSRAQRMTGEPFDKYVGIIPIKEASVITTRGLEWDVQDWKTEFGGQMSTSNHLLPDTKVVEVETTNDVLFTIALKPIPDTV